MKHIFGKHQPDAGVWPVYLFGPMRTFYEEGKMSSWLYRSKNITTTTTRKPLCSFPAVTHWVELRFRTQALVAPEASPDSPSILAVYGLVRSVLFLGFLFHLALFVFPEDTGNPEILALLKTTRVWFMVSQSSRGQVRGHRHNTYIHNNIHPQFWKRR